MQRARQHSSPQSHDRLDHTTDTGGRLRMTDVRLQRSEIQRPFYSPPLPIGIDQRLRLNRIPEHRTRTVCLDGVHIPGAQPGVGERLADHPLLGGSVGSGEPIAGAVLVDGGATDDGQHPVSLAHRVRQPLDHEHTDALGPGRAVGAVGERLAASVVRESALPAELDEHVRAGHDGRAAGQRHRALTPPQRLRREVEGDEGGGAGGVDGDGGSFEAVGVGEAAGGDAAGGPGEAVPLDGVRGTAQQGSVVLRDRADEDAGRAGLECGGVDARAFERLPGGLHQQALLGVHGEGFARGDPEELGVEVGDGVEEPTVPYVGLAEALGVRIVDAVEIPAPVGREVRDRVTLFRDEPPQILGGLDSAREAAGHPDDRDRLVRLDRRDGRGGKRRGVAQEPGLEVLGQRGGRRVVEGQGSGELEAGGGVEAVAQFDRGEGVETRRLEGLLRRDQLR
ncbi:hypothetical protein GCM10018772_62440 [Streptomyces fumanus]|uniref:Uncharacterized protein n=1 Tax=Streptomyces fumanus TaxID=67302 RepID=A0A919AXM6_9ACTN|nr:hypothetical protein GCM10018772_62440 [Streptomyces fumanus]